MLFRSILSFYKKVLKKHGEGLVITHPDSKYDVSDKRSGERVKLKGRNDAEGVVVGHIMGGSRGFKSLDVSYNGTTFHLGIGFNFEQRDNYKKLLDYFPENTKEGYKTEALPSIWENKDEFNALMKKTSDDMIKLAKAIETAEDLRAAQKELMWSNCTACHSRFRAPH